MLNSLSQVTQASQLVELDQLGDVSSDVNGVGSGPGCHGSGLSGFVHSTQQPKLNWIRSVLKSNPKTSHITHTTLLGLLISTPDGSWKRRQLPPMGVGSGGGNYTTAMVTEIL